MSRHASQAPEGTGEFSHTAPARACSHHLKAMKEKSIAMNKVIGRAAGRRGRGIRQGAIVLGLAALVSTVGSAGGAGAATTPPPGGSASGSVASISGTSMEVQNTTGQTTVNWTGTTTFSQTVTEAVSSLAVGDCLTVTGTPAKKSKTTITARSITVSPPPASGKCGVGGGAAGRFGGGAGGFVGRPAGGGGFGGGGGGGFAGGAGGAGAGGAGGGFRRFAGTSNLAIGSGKVTAISGSSITMSGYLLSSLFGKRPAKSTSKTSKSKPKITLPKTEKLKITTSKSTTVSSTQSATSSALAVKDCVTAFGPTTTTGAITAATVRITSTGATTCSAFGGFGGGGFGGGGGGGAGG
jgi:hypothetical protein